MCPFYSVLLPALLAVQLSISEDTTEDVEFEGRWITRPPYDQEFKHAVLIVTNNGAEDENCTGALIGSPVKPMEWVLTAARCMYDKDHRKVEDGTSLTVYAGVDRLGGVNAEHVQKSQSKALYIHDIPNKDSYFSLALVKLKEPFIKSKSGSKKEVEPLDLTLDYDLEAWEAPELVCRSASYGRIEWDVEVPTALKKTVTIIRRCNCSQTLQRVFHRVSTDQWMCGENMYDVGVCKGDFGTTIACGQPSAAFFIGVAIDIVSFRPGTCEVAKDGKVSKECGESSSANVYADVCYHLEWISGYVPGVLPNETACDRPGAAVSVHSRFSILSFTSLYFFWGFGRWN